MNATMSIADAFAAFNNEVNSMNVLASVLDGDYTIDCNCAQVIIKHYCDHARNALLFHVRLIAAESITDAQRIMMRDLFQKQLDALDTTSPRFAMDSIDKAHRAFERGNVIINSLSGM